MQRNLLLVLLAVALCATAGTSGTSASSACLLDSDCPTGCHCSVSYGTGQPVGACSCPPGGAPGGNGGNAYNDDPCFSRLQSCNNSCLHSSDVNACAQRCGVAFGQCGG